jgi:hypothetical protein
MEGFGQEQVGLVQGARFGRIQSFTNAIRVLKGNVADLLMKVFVIEKSFMLVCLGMFRGV